MEQPYLLLFDINTSINYEKGHLDQEILIRNTCNSIRSYPIIIILDSTTNINNILNEQIKIKHESYFVTVI